MRKFKNKCEASGAKLVGRDWYSVRHIDGKTICNSCNKPIKLRVVGEVSYIPAHNEPEVKS